MTTQRRLRFVVSGMIAAVPFQGGLSWVVLHYLLGFRRLGHDVLLVESMPPSALQPAGVPLAATNNARCFRAVMADHGLVTRSALLLDDTRETVGAPMGMVEQFARNADVLVNIGGMLRDEALIETPPIRLYLDLDPVFTQFWHAKDGIDMGLAGHTHFATVGLNRGRPGSITPDCGVSWLPTVPPVVLSEWPVASHVQSDAFTTVANWRGYGSVEHDGVFYGQKVHSRREFMELPLKTRQRFVASLAIHPDETRDLERLRQNRWEIVEPERVGSTPDDYRRFVTSSRAEIGIAKSGYALARSGWFSDRSVCYLASGRPVVAQETGFSADLPTGEGLLTFDTLDRAAEAVIAVNRDYERHATGARHVARECFDSDRVLATLLRRIGAAA